MAIIEDVAEKKESSTRFSFRFIPIDLMCKAGKFEEFKVLAAPYIRKYFPTLEESGGEVT